MLIGKMQHKPRKYDFVLPICWFSESQCVQCVNNACRETVNPQYGSDKVICSNVAGRRKMFV